MSEKKKNSSSSSKGTVHVVRTSFDQILEKNGFRLTNVIGNGSYAKVKYAREGEYTSKSGDSKKIAAKIIDKRRAPSDFVNRFLPRELEIYQRLNHPNIVKVYHIMEINPRIYIFMELAEGGDLLDFIKKRGALSGLHARQMFGELASAIRYCHSLHITHRDLKCENILLDKGYHVKLADFGFSRSCVDGDTGKRILSQTYCGSAAYAAPEILQGTPYNPKLYDIWSLGCILYIMVCGFMPFDDSDVKKMIKVQIERRVKFPNGFDPIAKSLIMQMLEPDVTRRANIEKVLRHPWLTDFV